MLTQSVLIIGAIISIFRPYIGISLICSSVLIAPLNFISEGLTINRILGICTLVGLCFAVAKSKSNFKINFSGLEKYSFIYIISIMLSIAFSGFQHYYGSKIMEPIIGFIILILMVSTINSEKKLDFFLKVLFFTGLFTVYTYLNFISSQNVSEFLLKGRISTYMQVNAVANAAGISMISGLFLRQKGLASVSIFYLLSSFMLIPMLIGESRVGALMVIVIALVYIIFVFLVLVSKNIISLSFYSIFFVVIIFFIFTILAENILELRMNRMEITKDVKRLAGIKAGLNAFLHNPIFGVGFGGWYVYVKKVYSPFISNIPSTAHNSYVDILAETGIIGFYSFLSMLALVYKKIVATSRASVNSTELPSALYCLFLTSLIIWPGAHGQTISREMFICMGVLSIIHDIKFKIISYE